MQIYFYHFIIYLVQLCVILLRAKYILIILNNAICCIYLLLTLSTLRGIRGMRAVRSHGMLLTCLIAFTIAKKKLKYCVTKNIKLYKYIIFKNFFLIFRTYFSRFIIGIFFLIFFFGYKFWDIIFDVRRFNYR